jgi:5'-3' exonuclease
MANNEKEEAIRLYRAGMGELGGYVTNAGEVDLRRAEILLKKVRARSLAL